MRPLDSAVLPLDSAVLLLDSAVRWGGWRAVLPRFGPVQRRAILRNGRA